MSVISSLFGGKQPEVKPLPPLPTREDPALTAKMEEERLAARRRAGRAGGSDQQTTLGGAMDAAPTVERPQLKTTLGGAA